MSALLQAQGISVSYGHPARRLGDSARRIWALRDVDLQVQHSSIVAIVGESGAGKSTLARVLSGLSAAEQGSIHYEGQIVQWPPDRRLARNIQMVFQDPGSSLNPALSVRAMLAELLSFHDLLAGEQINARCAELMQLVHLPAKTLDVKPRELSGGERQRVALARALAVQPRVLIADEAVSALDASVAAAILDLLVELKDRLGLAILLIAHDLAAVRAVCEQVLVMHAGQILEHGLTEQVFSEPQHPYTRQLLASLPTLSCRDADHAVGP